jgi:biotin carboxylase
VPEGPGVRLDSGVGSGSFVPPYYDSMIAKLIVTAGDRPGAIELLGRALDDFCVEGIRTNIPLLRRLVRDPEYVENNTSTRWLDATAMNLIRKDGP